jgi:hypothetical protein
MLIKQDIGSYTTIMDIQYTIDCVTQEIFEAFSIDNHIVRIKLISHDIKEIKKFNGLVPLTQITLNFDIFVEREQEPIIDVEAYQ